MFPMKRWGLLCLLVIIAFVFNQPVQGRRSFDRDIYQRAWQLVKDNYYDTSFNGQNWGSWEHRFDGRIHSTAEAFSAVKEMLGSLNDPYTRFLNPRTFQDENDAMEARIVGIGINIQQSKDHQSLIITRTLENSPAEQAGIQSGDEIVAIDGNTAIGLTPDQAADRIRGKIGTAVRICIKHNELLRTVPITRAQLIIKAVSTKMLPSKMGYIQLSTFISNDASREFRSALHRLSSADGLIIDLRDNPGGLLSNALEIADMLLERGTIVSTIGRHGRHIDLSSEEPVTRQPVVVLVDGESASASEILAGALKDNHRAIIVGSRTYGKGLVQEINQLPAGAAIHVTVSKYLTPNGTDINKIGIMPDVEVVKHEEQLTTAITCLKKEIAGVQKIPCPTLTVKPFPVSSGIE